MNMVGSRQQTVSPWPPRGRKQVYEKEMETVRSQAGTCEAGDGEYERREV